MVSFEAARKFKGQNIAVDYNRGGYSEGYGVGAYFWGGHPVFEIHIGGVPFVLPLGDIKSIGPSSNTDKPLED